jgi:pyruvate,orthophosphate dikinase
MHSAAGILTSTGGMTSHAAVVARGWGKCCVAGAGDDRDRRREGAVHRSAGPVSARRHDLDRRLDGRGAARRGRRRSSPTLSGDFAKVMRWADKYRTLGVRTNADTPEDAQRARDFGAEGIGLCRTEHMFFEGERIRRCAR